jgi:hypothetical protein
LNPIQNRSFTEATPEISKTVIKSNPPINSAYETPNRSNMTSMKIETSLSSLDDEKIKRLENELRQKSKEIQDLREENSKKAVEIKVLNNNYSSVLQENTILKAG